MQKATELPEVIVSETGAAIPAEVLHAAGIEPGERVAFVRTTRGSLMVVRAAPQENGPSLRTVAGINPRPVGMPPATDQVFLRDIRVGDEGL